MSDHTASCMAEPTPDAPTPDVFAPTPATTVHRHPERARYDKASVHAILDEALFCHVGFVAEGRAVVIPCIQARVGDTLYLHGAVASRLMETASSGAELCVTATLLDGLVLARSWFAHSMNYRSAVVFGAGRLVTDLVEKARALRAIVEHVAPGRSRDARPPTPKEMAATAVVAMSLACASAKVRKGLPRDQDADYELPVWAGEIPLQLQPLAPVTDPRVDPDVAVPAYVRHYSRPGPSVHGQQAPGAGAPPDFDSGDASGWR
jgi:nitroimidazol reductase NimA-like FMN-containing flavoprotein (pyridoxamine 5'-phosphate oxidase superfamily)